MRRPTPRHPLQSFRFWFLVLSTIAVATAWKLDLFGNRRAQSAADLVEEDLPLPDDEEAIEIALAEESGAEPEATPKITPRRLRPVAEPAPQVTATESEAPGAESSEAFTRAKPAPQKSPFGPANPEFVAAPPETAEPPRPISDTGAASAKPTDDELRRTAMIEETVASANVQRELVKDAGVVPASNSQAADLRTPRQADPTATDPTAPAAGQSTVDLAEVDRLIESGDDVGAHRMMSRWYWKSPESRPLFQERLESMAKRIYLQPHPHFMEPRIIQAGDVLQTISKDYNVSWQYLAKLNRTDPKRIRPGQKLKVIKGPFAAVVDLSDFELTVHAHGYFVKKYAIGIGRDESSPVGTFKVEEKLTDPTYYGPDAVVEHDDPSNPLGEFWIGIGDSFGIHGTIEPDSIGKAESRGCIRMRNEDIADVYDFLTLDSEVVIRR